MGTMPVQLAGRNCRKSRGDEAFDFLRRDVDAMLELANMVPSKRGVDRRQIEGVAFQALHHRADLASVLARKLNCPWKSNVHDARQFDAQVVVLARAFVAAIINERRRAAGQEPAVDDEALAA